MFVGGVKVGGANLGGQMKRDKTFLLSELQKLDKIAEETGLTSAQWNERYSMEEGLERIYSFEEIQWKRRYGEKWLLKGGSNTGYFHSVANGRKKKCTIVALEEDGMELVDPRQIREHVFL